MSLNDTPSGNRLHIGIFGKTNSGKSTLLNSITKQDVSMVSPIKGTTTDPVNKAMELHGIGPVMFHDSAGFDDDSILGKARADKSYKLIDQCDMAIMMFHDENIQEEKKWLKYFDDKKIPVLCLYNQFNNQEEVDITTIIEEVNREIVKVDASDKKIVEKIISHLMALLPQDFNSDHIVWHLVKPHDLVLLVMPQDIQAPKGRLILPQVQTIRDLLDIHAVVVSISVEELEVSLSLLKKAPKLIICDSQVFDKVYQLKPSDSLLTSFSMLFARLKGDIEYFVEGARAIDNLTIKSKVLIAEACTHAPISEDIGRVKIPNMLRKKIGKELQIDIVSGKDFPQDLSCYDLIIHCGACMFHRNYVLARVNQAKKQNVAMCNYGVCIAYLKSILDYVIY